MICKIKDIIFDYEVIGQGKPILILHKSMIEFFEPVFVERTGWKRIYVNYPGIGKTEVKDWMKSAEDILNPLNDFVDFIVGEKNFLLMGFSYSCFLARGILKKKLSQVDGIAMLCPVVVADSAKREVPSDRVVFKDMQFLNNLTSDQVNEISNYVIQNKRIWDKTQEETSDDSNSMNFEFYNSLKQNGAYGFSFDVDDIPVKFSKPSLILLGRQDYVVGYKDAWKILDNYPRATFSILDMTGHGMLTEQEHLYSTFINDWIDRVEMEESLVIE